MIQNVNKLKYFLMHLCFYFNTVRVIKSREHNDLKYKLIGDDIQNNVYKF
jgi:hypothetical protein